MLARFALTRQGRENVSTVSGGNGTLQISVAEIAKRTCAQRIGAHCSSTWEPIKSFANPQLDSQRRNTNANPDTLFTLGVQFTSAGPFSFWKNFNYPNKIST